MIMERETYEAPVVEVFHFENDVLTQESQA